MCLSLSTDIHLSSSQFLYRSCTALDPHSKTPCGLPVLDILSLESVCPKHVRIGDTSGISKPFPSRKSGARGVAKSGGLAVGTKIRGSKQVVSKVTVLTIKAYLSPVRMYNWLSWFYLIKFIFICGVNLIVCGKHSHMWWP